MMKRFFLIVGLGVLTGAFICSFLPVAMMAALCLTAAFLFLLGLFVWWRKRGNYAMILSLFLGCFLLSATLYYQQETKVYLPLQQLNGVETATVSTVEDISLRDGGKYTYLVKIESVSGMDLPRSRVSCLIYSSRSLELAIGDEISAVMTFYLPAEGNSRTLQNYYKSDRIFLCASLSDAEQMEITPASFSIKRKLYSLRREWQTLFYEHLSEDGAAVLSTMILGLDEDVSYPLEQNYMDAGMIHLFAISGIHMMLFAGIAERVFSLLFRQKKRRGRVLAVLCTMVSLSGYLLISGASVSAIRSGWMISLLLAGKCFRRPSDSLNSLFFAGFLIVLQNVYAIIDIGFLMSFLSCLGIILFARKTADFLSLHLHLFSAGARYLLESLSITFSANLCLLPVYLTSFGYLSLGGFVANLIAVPLASPILLFGFLGILFSPVLPEWCLQLLFMVEDVFISLLNKTAALFAALPFSSIGLMYDEIRIAGFLFLAFALLLWGGWKRNVVSGKRAVLSVLLSAFLLFGTAGILLATEQEDLSVYFVGDGSYANCIVVYEGQVTVISSGDDDYIDELTRSFLRQKNLNQIENLILTYQSFHSYQDTVHLLESVPVANVFYPEKNVEAEFLLKNTDFDGNLFPINQSLTSIRCEAERSLTITPEIRSNAVMLTLSYDEKELFFFGTAKSATASDAPVLCLRSYDRGLCDSYSQEGKVILASNRFVSSETEEILPAYQKTFSFRFREGMLVYR